MAPTVSSIYLSILQLSTVFFYLHCFPAAKAQPLFPAILVFGDSTVDTGNTNYISPLVSINRADHRPYGQDFPGHVPTGRYSNGRLIPDFIGSALGLKDTGVVPPFLDPKLSTSDLLTGVTFAVAGSGFDGLTSGSTGTASVQQQAEEYLKKYVEKLKKVAGVKEAERIVKGALVLVSAGTNDFALNFYDLPTRRLQFDIDRYQDFILKQLQGFLKEVYEQGCRTIIVAGLPPLGCLPIQMTTKFKKSPETRVCLEEQNSDAITYNKKLKKLLPQIKSSLPGARLFYADIYTPLMDRINHAQRYGVKVTDRGCCGTGFFEVGGLCNSLTPACKNASEYVFWDSAHPTESTYQYIFAYLIQELGPELIGDDNHLPSMS